MCTSIQELCIKGLISLAPRDLVKIANSLPKITVCVCQRISESLKPDDVEKLVRTWPNLRSIVIDPYNGNRYNHSWANLIDRYCSRVRFGHAIIESTPGYLLSYHRSYYSM